MTKEFVPYTEALELKELGFNEPCFAWWCVDGRLVQDYSPFSEEESVLQAPIYQQVFRWFRDAYGLFGTIKIDQTTEPKFWFSTVRYESTQFFEGWYDDEPSSLYYSYEQAEIECLRKLIEIVKTKQI